VEFVEFRKSDTDKIERIGAQLKLAPGKQGSKTVGYSNYHRIAIYGNSKDDPKKGNIADGNIRD
jgi:hypothetical protein